MGASAISVEAANAMNHSLIMNSETQEIKSQWNIIVEYVKGSAEESVILEVGDDSTLTIRLDSTWEDICG